MGGYGPLLFTCPFYNLLLVYSKIGWCHHYHSHTHEVGTPPPSFTSPPPCNDASYAKNHLMPSSLMWFSSYRAHNSPSFMPCAPLSIFICGLWGPLSAMGVWPKNDSDLAAPTIPSMDVFPMHFKTIRQLLQLHFSDWWMGTHEIGLSSLTEIQPCMVCGPPHWQFGFTHLYAIYVCMLCDTRVVLDECLGSSILCFYTWWEMIVQVTEQEKSDI